MRYARILIHTVSRDRHDCEDWSKYPDETPTLNEHAGLFGSLEKLTGSMPRLPVSVTVPCWPAMICPFHWQRVGPHRRAVEAMRYSQHAVRRIGEPAAPLPVDSTPLAGRVVDSQWITSRLSTVGRLRNTQTTDRQRNAGVSRLRNPQTTGTEPISTAPTFRPANPTKPHKRQADTTIPLAEPCLRGELLCQKAFAVKRSEPANQMRASSVSTASAAGTITLLSPLRSRISMVPSFT